MVRDDNEDGCMLPMHRPHQATRHEDVVVIRERMLHETFDHRKVFRWVAICDQISLIFSSHNTKVDLPSHTTDLEITQMRTIFLFSPTWELGSKKLHRRHVRNQCVDMVLGEVTAAEPT